jgi:hypothetical protein
MKSKLPAQQSEEQLAHLLQEINEETEICFKEGKSNLERVRDLGGRLIAAKSLVKHGQWKTWAHDNLKFSLDSGQRFMRINREWDKVKAAPVPLLGVKDAISYLASLNKKPVPESKTAKQQAEKGLKGLRKLTEALQDLGVHDAHSEALGVLESELTRFTADEAAGPLHPDREEAAVKQPGSDELVEQSVAAGVKAKRWES